MATQAGTKVSDVESGVVTGDTTEAAGGGIFGILK